MKLVLLHVVISELWKWMIKATEFEEPTVTVVAVWSQLNTLGHSGAQSSFNNKHVERNLQQPPGNSQQLWGTPQFGAKQSQINNIDTLGVLTLCLVHTLAPVSVDNDNEANEIDLHL